MLPAIEAGWPHAVPPVTMTGSSQNLGVSGREVHSAAVSSQTALAVPAFMQRFHGVPHAAAHSAVLQQS
jgi:hypothetical protein